MPRRASASNIFGSGSEPMRPSIIVVIVCLIASSETWLCDSCGTASVVVMIVLLRVFQRVVKAGRKLRGLGIDRRIMLGFPDAIAVACGWVGMKNTAERAHGEFNYIAPF